MKSYNWLIYTLFAIFVLSSCKTDDFPSFDKEIGKKVKLNISAAINVENTRVDMTDMKSHVKCEWSEGDQIGIMIPGKFNICYRAVKDGDNVSFVPTDGSDILEAEIGDELIAYYPYQSDIDESSFKEKGIIDVNCNIYSPMLYLSSEDDRISSIPCVLTSKCKVTGEEICLYFEHMLSYLHLKMDADMFDEQKGLHINVLTPDENFFPEIDYDIIRLVFNEEGCEIVNYGYEYGLSFGGGIGDSSIAETYIPIMPLSSDDKLILSENPYFPDSKIIKNIPEGGLKRGTVYNLTISSEDFVNAENKVRGALRSLYESLGGDKWTDNTNWCSNRPISEWYGITYNQWWGYELNLVNNNLTGRLPAEIGDLDGFYYLNLSQNKITGRIPEEISKLITLRELRLYRNVLNGKIPDSMANLINMTCLVLGDGGHGYDVDDKEGHGETNNLSGNIFEIIKSWPNLNMLSLQGNNFSGEIGELSEGQINNICYLNLCQNHFSGKLPSLVIKMMDKLHTLTLEQQENGGVSNPLQFYMDHNDFTGVVPEEILNHPVAPALYDVIVPQNEGFGFDECRHPFFKNDVVCYDGSTMNLGELYKQHKWTVLFLWDELSSEEYLDKMLAFKEDYEKNDVVVVGVTDRNLSNSDEVLSTEAAEKYLEKMSCITNFWENGVNNIYPKNNWYLFDIYVIPSLISYYIWLIDNEGNLVYKYLGNNDCPQNDVFNQLDKIIKTK